MDPVTDRSLCTWKYAVVTAGNSRRIDLCEADESRAGKHDGKSSRNDALLVRIGVNGNADIDCKERENRMPRSLKAPVRSLR